MLLTFQEDMDMLSSRQELMLKKPRHTWMGPRLMGMLFEQSSHYRKGRKYHHHLRWLLLHQRKMVRKLILLVLMLKRVDQSGRENLLPLASLFPPCEGDLLSHEEVDLLGEIQTLLFVVVWTLLFVVVENLLTAEVKHPLGGGLHLQYEVVHLPLHQEGTDRL
jgi:hypothetical protein